jgi:hypothetical protein
MAGALRLDCIVVCADAAERFDELWLMGAGKGDFEANIAMVKN